MVTKREANVSEQLGINVAILNEERRLVQNRTCFYFEINSTLQVVLQKKE